MGVLSSWRTPDGRIIVDQVFGEGNVQHRIWEDENGHVLAAELPPPTERLREWLTRHGWDLGDLIPVEQRGPIEQRGGEDGDDPACE